MELRQKYIRTCTYCSAETCDEEAITEIGLQVSVKFPNSDCNASASKDSAKNRTILKMQGMLDQYFNEAEVDANCTICDKKTLHRRKSEISDHPEVLVVQAKLFNFTSGRSQKKNIFIDPDDIVINAGGAQGMDRILYKAYAVVAHIGTRLERGHFLTIACGSGCSARIPRCDSQSGCWWLFDDEKVDGPMPQKNALELLTQRQVSF